jgi:hypothetical protein
MTKIGIPEVGTAQVSTAEISTPQIRTPQVIMAEVGLAQVRMYLCMLLSPGIPNIPSLPQQAKLLSIYQVAHLLPVLTLERAKVFFARTPITISYYRTMVKNLGPASVSLTDRRFMLHKCYSSRHHRSTAMSLNRQNLLVFFPAVLMVA